LGVKKMIPTVVIVHPEIEGEFIVINESEFDPERHRVFEEPGVRSQEPGEGSWELSGSDEEGGGDGEDGEGQESGDSSSPTPHTLHPTPDFAATRTAELQAMEAGEVRKIAEALGIGRPRSGGWATTIPEIVERELAARGSSEL
jgi:hypothetical protein